MFEDQFFYAVLAVIWVDYLWELYLSIRQHSVYIKTKSVPSELKGSINEETFNKSRSYAIDKSYFSIIRGFYSVVICTVLIVFFIIHCVWECSKSIFAHVNLDKNELAVSAVFIVLINTLNTLTTLPMTIYNTFVLEEKHGFNKQTVRFFIKDQLKAYLLSSVIFVPLTCIAIYIIKIGGAHFYVYLWVFAMLVLLFLMTIYPDYIAPLFDKYTPLPQGELRTRIEELASDLKFPLYRLYLVEGSKRSVHSNAYFYGFFKNKRIVLFDTLLKDESKDDGKGCDNDEILAVLAHEFGHWQYNHVLKNIVIMQVNLFLQFFAFGYLFQIPELYRAFNFTDEQPIIIGLIIVLQYVFAPYNSVMAFLLTMLSRKFEFQADFFAKSHGRANFLKKALIKLHKDNLSFPVYDRLYSAWHHSHPTLLQRLEFLDKED